jgi:hypothetical protein
MPLIQSKSKKAFEKNVKTEMDANPGKENRAQNLAIAYSIKRKNSKKMAHGGKVDIDAKSEDRPMPDESHADAHSQARNSGDKALRDSDWTDQPTVAQAQMSSSTKLSQPEGRKLQGRNDEDDMMDSMAPGPYGAKPPSRDDEEDPNRQGPKVSDMAHQHNNGRAAYAHGGMANKVAHQMGEEGPGRSDPDSSMLESHDYGMGPNSPDEEHPHTGETEADMLRRHAMELAHFAQGGPTGPMNPKLAESHKEPHEEGSMAKEIMRKRMASGGQVDLEANSEEDLNNEDQMSFDAGLKEQYDLRQLKKQPMDSNEKGDSREAAEENDHDESIVSAIRKKSKKKAE